MSAIALTQYYLVLAISVVALGLEVFALIDAARHRPDAYVAAGKRTKQFWLAVTGGGALLGFISLGWGLGFLAIAGIVIAGVYLADVRPALRQIMGGNGQRMGPYGPW